MKKLLLVFSFLPLCSHAQTFSATKFGETEFQKQGDMPIGTKDGFIGVDIDYKLKFGYTVKLSKINYFTTLLKYDKALNVVKENKITSDDNKFGPFAPALFQLNEKACLFYYQFSGEDLTINAAEIDPETLTLKNSKKLMTIDQKNVGLFKLGDLSMSYQHAIEHSPDNKSFVFLWKSGVDNRFCYAVTDDQLNVSVSKTETINDAKDLDLNNVIVDNDKNVFASFFSEIKDTKHQFVFGNYKGLSTVNPVEITDKELRYVYVCPVASEERIRICGVYSDDYYINGTFSQTFLKDGLKADKVYTSDFSEDLVEKFKKEGYAKAKKRKFGLYPEMDFDIRTINGVSFLAGDVMSFASTEKSSVTFKGSTLLVIFNGDSILSKRLPKETFMSSNSRSLFFPYKDRLALFYIDGEKNIAAPVETGNTDQCNRCDHYLIGVLIDKNGNISRKTVNMGGESRAYFGTYVREINDRSFYFNFIKLKATLSQYKSAYSTYRMEISE